MAKAGNLEILKSGWTFGGRVHLIGEIVPLPEGFTPMDEEEQQEYYGGKVFYRVTDKAVNITGGAAGWKPRPEPADTEAKPQPLTPEGQTEFGGASAAFHPVAGATPRSELPDEMYPDNSDKPKRAKRKNEEAVSSSEETETRQPIRLKKNIRGRKKKTLVPAKATKLSRRK